MTVEYNAYLKSLNDDDVLEFKHKLFKFGQLKNALNSAFGGSERLAKELYEILKESGIEIVPTIHGYYHSNQKNPSIVPKYQAWFQEGIEVAALKASSSSGWQKGNMKIKVSVEFIPDEPEIPEYQSPLDEIRREMQQNS